ncbi:MAG: hypothetical protein B0D92_08190 [Spirochaeta sp. LUC14_002_19_P3]|nr:MAG: hypothetical protein B0D92_08190 [Spirochaeta sp. LUC14_002_19_P3]
MNEVIMESAKTGALTARYNSISIHSGYDPEKEALRFLDSQQIDARGTVVIIGAGLGYLDALLSAKYPACKIISCHLIPELYRRRIESKAPVHRWNPAANTDIESYFFEVIEELDTLRLHIVEWPAEARAVPGEAAQVRNALRRVVRRYTGNITTTAAFGRLWLRNTLRNFLEIDKFTVPEQFSGAVVIAASGPSLEYQLAALKANRDKFQLWALPSSLPALLRAEIQPNLIFSSDPGHWTRLHSRYFPKDIPIAMPLTALPPPPSSAPPMLLSQNASGESFLLGAETWPRVQVPQAGSVAITAIEAWRKLCRGPLVLAGLDLCWSDLRAHTRPHAFDSWFAAQAGRLRPHLAIQWKNAESGAPRRIGRFRTGFALSAYADWFQSIQFDAPVFRLTAKDQPEYPNALHGVKNAGEAVFNEFTPVTLRCRVQPAPLNREKRRQKILSLLRQWHENSDMNVGYFLDPRGILNMARRGTVSEEAWENHCGRVKEALRELMETCER